METPARDALLPPEQLLFDGVDRTIVDRLAAFRDAHLGRLGDSLLTTVDAASLLSLSLSPSLPSDLAELLRSLEGPVLADTSSLRSLLEIERLDCELRLWERRRRIAASVARVCERFAGIRKLVARGDPAGCMAAFAEVYAVLAPSQVWRLSVVRHEVLHLGRELVNMMRQHSAKLLRARPRVWNFL